MGTEALWIPLLLAGAGAGVNYYNTKKTQDKQNDQIVQGLQQQRAKQGEINRSTDEVLSKFAASNPAGDKAKSQAQYTQQLAKNKGQATGGLTEVSGASDEYKAGNQDAAAGIGDFGAMLTDILSRIDAPEQQRTREGQLMADYGVDLDRKKREASGEARINQMKLQGINENPWLSALSQTLNGAATSMGTGGAGADIFSKLFGGGATNFGVPGMLPIPKPGIGALPGFDTPLWKF
jgi:hypothetical protein